MLSLVKRWQSPSQVPDSNASNVLQEPSSPIAEKNGLVTAQLSQGSDDKSSLKEASADIALTHDVDQTSPGELTFEEGQ